MTKYVLTYHGDMINLPTEQSEIDALMEQWGAWYGSMGEALVDGGAPFDVSTAVGPDGSTVEAPAKLTGYTIINADDVAGATEIARGCPVLANGHTVQISEAHEM